MQYVCVDTFRPEWKMWVRFAGEREMGMTLDSVHTTRPIEFPVHSPAEAMAMADPITYQKGSSVLKMLEQYLSAATFRNGIRHYLQEHAYGNTVTGDLWASLEAVSGQPVGEIMHSWIHQGGHPIVSVQGSTLRQRPFTLGPAQGPSAIGDRWLVPVVERCLSGGEGTVQLLREESQRLECAAPVLVNAGGAGVYRTSYGDKELSAVLDHLDSLSEIERAGLVGDITALAFAGDRSLADVLGVASRLGMRVEPTVWEAVDRVVDVLDRTVAAELRPQLAAKVRSLMGPLFAELGWDATPGEDERAQVLRATLVRRLGTTGEDAAIREEAVGRFDQGALAGDLATAIVAVVASLNRPGDYEEMVRRFKAAPDPQTEQRYQSGVACFTDEAMVMRAYEEVFETFRSQDAPLVIFHLVSNRVAGLAVWSAIAGNWEATIERIPMALHFAVGVGLIRQIGDPDMVERATAFHRDHVLPAGQRLIEQALEWFAASSRLAARERPMLGETLA